MYNYTLIIPHKNTPDLLQRCIDSVPERNDLNIIIVDDNSDPSIVDFENFPGAKRPNTTLIFNKDGLGAGHARNVGLEAIKETKWVFFSDSDDFFTPYLNEALDKYLNDESDVIYFNYSAIYSDTLQPSQRDSHSTYKIKEAIKKGDYNILRFKTNAPYCKFISYNIIHDHHLRYDEVMYANDVMFAMRLGVVSSNIKYDENTLYYLTERPGSLVTVIKKEAIECRYKIAVNAMSFLKKNNYLMYHSNLFAYCQKFAKVSLLYAIKYFFISLYYTPIKYWIKDLWACFKEVIK